MSYVVCRNIGCDFEIEADNLNPEENRYCPKCGLPLAYECTPPPNSGQETCGRAIDLPGQRHCMKCGRPLKVKPEKGR